MRLMVEAIVSVGGPETLITTPKEPTLESGQVIMTHPDVAILSITGGEAVVSVAMKLGKKCIAAGPGNPPVIVDDTADIEKAGKDVVDGASFDNNVLCIAEKEVFVFASVADRLMAAMERNGAFRVSGADIDKIVNTVLIPKNGKYVINRKYVGRNAAVDPARLRHQLYGRSAADHRRCGPQPSLCDDGDADAGTGHRTCA